ncbi:MAG: AAA family ATPase [Methanomassiliicoccaceae archaeon]|nr:AAA family ATPase [Methanomassiliicoccaceae archaeon]
MFKKIVLDNYLSFRHIEMDLTGSGNEPVRHAFIYGENGSGKSNLIESLMMLKDSMKTVNRVNRLKEFTELRETLKKMNSKEGTSAADDDPDTSDTDELKRMMRLLNYDITDISKGIRMTGSDAGTSASFCFTLGGHDGSYDVRFDPNDRLVYERLCFVVESRSKDIFEISSISGDDASPNGNLIDMRFSPQLFKDNVYRRTIEDIIQRYWGKHSFMSILDDQYSSNNQAYMEKNLGTGIDEVIEFFNDLVVCCVRTRGKAGRGIKDKILANLGGGRIAHNEKERLQIYEEALNSFFTRIYSDVKKVYYRTEQNGNILNYTLFFSKMIGGKRRDIGISEESTGTTGLLDLFPAFFECARGRTVFFDELDSGIHDLLIKELIDELKDSFKGQFVATTHNTSLLEIIDPKKVFVIQVDSRGEKRILPISSIERTQKNHNNRSRYLKGVFDAVPVMGEIDLIDIVHRVESNVGGTE